MGNDVSIVLYEFMSVVISLLGLTLQYDHQHFYVSQLTYEQMDKLLYEDVVMTCLKTWKVAYYIVIFSCYDMFNTWKVSILYYYIRFTKLETCIS